MGSGFELLRCALADPFSLTVSPNPIRQDVQVASINGVIADRLTLEVVGKGIDAEAVAGMLGASAPVTAHTLSAEHVNLLLAGTSAVGQRN